VAKQSLPVLRTNTTRPATPTWSADTRDVNPPIEHEEAFLYGEESAQAPTTHAPVPEPTPTSVPAPAAAPAPVPLNDEDEDDESSDSVREGCAS